MLACTCTRARGWALQAPAPAAPAAAKSRRGGAREGQLVECQVVVPMLAVDAGQHVALVGSCAALGSWKPEQGLRLSPGPDLMWRASVKLPVGKQLTAKVREGTVPCAECPACRWGVWRGRLPEVGPHTRGAARSGGRSWS